MTEKKEVRLAGFGGQGIILSGHILGQAASLFDGKNAVFTQSYGPEARGGSCSADVVVADVPIYYPKVGLPDVLVVMSQGAWGTYGGSMRPGGILIMDEDLVTIDSEPEGVTVFRVPSTRIAEEMGRRIVANIVMLGAYIASSGVISKESIIKAVEYVLGKGKSHLIPVNEKAFDEGAKQI